MMCAPWIAAGCLFIALIPGLPYGYYQLLRWVVCAVSCYGAFIAVEKGKPKHVWLFAIIAVLFNPISPIHLSRAAWQLIDLVVGIIFLCAVSMFKIKK